MGGIAAIVQAAQQQVDQQFASFAKAGDLKAQARQLEYQASASDLNAGMSQDQGIIAASDDYLKNYRAIGRQAAAQAQGGTIGSASGQALLNESEAEAAKSARRIRLNADQQAASYLVDSIGLRSQAQGLRRNARIATLEGLLGPGARAITDPMKVSSAFN